MYPTVRRPRKPAVVLATACLALAAAALAMASASPSAACCIEPMDFDVTVDSVEVTQATQNLSNSIPLVARKSTAVRATIGRQGSAASVKVSGRLHVFVNSVEVTPSAGIAPIASLTVPGAPTRNNENHTLNFELRAPTLIPASTDVDFVVDIFTVSVVPKIAESDTTNNSGSADNLTAVERCTPWLYFTRIDYTPSGLGAPPLATVTGGVGDAFARGVLPVDDSDPLLYRETTPLTYNFDQPADGQLADPFEVNQLMTQLEAQRQLIVQNWIGANNRVFLYGWLAGNPTGGNNGYATLNGRVGLGNTEATRYQRTYAHELGHNFGLSHNATALEGLDEVGWDVGARLVANPVGNGVTGRAKPITTPISGPDFDVMTAGKLTNEAWINTTTYGFLRNHPTFGNCLVRPRPFYEEPRIAVITGMFSGNQMKLRPVYRFPWASEPSEAREGAFIAEVTDTNGVTTTGRFDADVRTDARDGHQSGGAFSIMLPVDPEVEIASLRILNAEQKVLAELERSEAPRIELLSPQPGETLSEWTEVQWAVDDPDTPDSELLLQAAYSNDNGRNWAPIEVDIAGSDRGFSFDASQVPESAGEGIIRVFVSDGLNTEYADVAGLTR
jgi:hypothetical protein